MSVPLTVVTNFEVTSQGTTLTGKQGLASSDFAEGYDITVTGYVQRIIGAISTASVRKLYDDDEDFPTDPLYWHFWADGNCYLQFVGTGTNFILPIAAYVPQTLYGATMLAAASTTDITGGSEPVLADIDHINVGNYSGASISYALAVIY